MSIIESKKDKLEKDDKSSLNVDMAKARIELALLKYKVVVGEGTLVAEGKKKVRL